MAIVNLGVEDLEVGNEWHLFTAVSVKPGDVVPLQALIVTTEPEKLYSWVGFRYTIVMATGMGTPVTPYSNVRMWQATYPQAIPFTVPPYLTSAEQLIVEARRFYSFRGNTAGSPMSLDISYETDHVYNISEPEDTYTIFTYGAITGGSIATIDFSSLTETYRIYAIWLNMQTFNDPADFQITINVGASIVAYKQVPAADVPWTPAPFLVSAANTMFISPTNNVNNVFMYAKKGQLTEIIGL